MLTFKLLLLVVAIDFFFMLIWRYTNVCGFMHRTHPTPPCDFIFTFCYPWPAWIQSLEMFVGKFQKESVMTYKYDDISGCVMGHPTSLGCVPIHPGYPFCECCLPSSHSVTGSAIRWTLYSYRAVFKQPLLLHSDPKHKNVEIYICPDKLTNCFL